MTLSLSACSGPERKVAIDPSDLHGVRVGVNLAWECDYFLTSRGDAELYRYDLTSDMLMALNYNKIDAVAIDEVSYRMVEAAVEGVSPVGPPIGYSAYMMIFAHDDERLRDEFNAFFADYSQSDDYTELMTRLKAFHGLYEGPDITSTGTGETVRVAVCDDGYPLSFLDVGAQEPQGYEIEVVKAWGNASNHRMEWYRSTYEDAIAGVMAGKYDAVVGFLSDLHAEEATMAGLYPSTGYTERPLYLVVKTGDAIRVTGEID